MHLGRDAPPRSDPNHIGDQNPRAGLRRADGRPRSGRRHSASATRPGGRSAGKHDGGRPRHDEDRPPCGRPRHDGRRRPGDHRWRVSRNVHRPTAGRDALRHRRRRGRCRRTDCRDVHRRSCCPVDRRSRPGHHDGVRRGHRGWATGLRCLTGVRSRRSPYVRRGAGSGSGLQIDIHDK